MCVLWYGQSVLQHLCFSKYDLALTDAELSLFDAISYRPCWQLRCGSLPKKEKSPSRKGKNRMAGCGRDKQQGEWTA